MEKIKILIFVIIIFVIIIILVLGDSIQSYAQFSIRNDSCHSSFLTLTINNKSSLFLSSTFAQEEIAMEGLSTFEKILNVPIGILFGSLCGYLIGTSIPRRDSEEKLVNGIKGGLVGAFVGPYVNYEIMSAMKGVRNPSNNWCFKAGGNITLPNYNNVKFKPGYSIGISRTYPLSNIIALQGNLAYQSRQFFLPSQKILHGMF